MQPLRKIMNLCWPLSIFGSYSSMCFWMTAMGSKLLPLISTRSSVVVRNRCGVIVSRGATETMPG